MHLKGILLKTEHELTKSYYAFFNPKYFCITNSVHLFPIVFTVCYSTLYRGEICTLYVYTYTMCSYRYRYIGIFYFSDHDMYM